METTFFTELHRMLNGAGARLSFTITKGKIVASFVPTGSDGTASFAEPLNMTGTPEEFNTGFLDEVDRAHSYVHSGLKTNMGKFKAQIEGTETEENKITAPATDGKVSPEMIEQVKRFKKQKKSFKTIAERCGITVQQVELILAGKDPNVTPGKQTDLVEQAEELEQEKPKVSHPEDTLANWKRLLIHRKVDAEEIVDRATKRLNNPELELSEEEKITLKGDITRNQSVVENCRGQIIAIVAKTYGTEEDQTVLIPAEEMTRRLTATKSN